MDYNDIKLTGVLEREAARMLVLTWLSEAVEIRQRQSDTIPRL